MDKTNDGAPHAFHKRTVHWIAKDLRRRGFEVQMPIGRSNACCCCDLVVSQNGDAPMRIAIKAATLKLFENRQRQNGRLYRYVYRAAITTFYTCRLSQHAAAEFVVVCIVEDKRIISTYIIPWRAIRQRHCMYVKPDSPKRHWFDRYLEAWQRLE